jgi:hypothetical protein
MGLGSGIRKKPIPDPGSRGQKDPGSGSATLIFKIFSSILEQGKLPFQVFFTYWSAFGSSMQFFKP